jgi:isoleucyl-tRNA synthetase
MPPLEKYILHRIAVVDDKLLDNLKNYDFVNTTSTLMDFINNDLSPLLFDIRKDTLYCGGKTDPTRRAYLNVLDIVFHALVRWWAPIFVFSTEEAWLTRFPNRESLHLATTHNYAGWRNDSLELTWEFVRSVREKVSLKMEPLRKSGTVGSGLETRVEILAKTSDIEIMKSMNFEQICLVSSVIFSESEELQVDIILHTGNKCDRCWKYADTVEDVCQRCSDVLMEI